MKGLLLGTELLVTGEILLPAPLSGATVAVRLQDVSMADARALVVAEQVIRGAEGDRIPFKLYGTPPDDERARYVVAVHIRMHRGSDVRPGDYITTQSYPVLQHGYPDHVTVRVQRVG